MNFVFPPVTFTEFLVFLAVVIGVLYPISVICAFIGRWLDAKGYGPQMERLRERSDAFRERYFLPAGMWCISQAERLAGLRRREKREKQ